MASVRIIRPRIIAFLLVAACFVAGQVQCNCTHGTSGHHYSQAEVTSAFNTAKSHQLKPIGKGQNPYPHYFGNGEKLAFHPHDPTCVKPDLLEFPILPGGVLFSSTSAAGADRILYHKTSGIFCGKFWLR